MRYCFLLFAFYFLLFPASFDAKTLSSAATQTTYPVIFVHGIGGGFQHWQDVLDQYPQSPRFEMRYRDETHIEHNARLSDITTGRSFWNVSYYSHNVLSETLGGNLTLYAERLGEIVGQIRRLCQADKVVIVAHSMGGLVSRRFMTLSDENWQSVHKILTVGSPHKGVKTSPGGLGQLTDLSANSQFIQALDTEWERYDTTVASANWGVLAGLSPYYRTQKTIHADATDFGGPGFVSLSSGIPFGDWEDAVKKIDDVYATEHFEFLQLIYASHLGLLAPEKNAAALRWALTP